MYTAVLLSTAHDVSLNSLNFFDNDSNDGIDDI
jgi:hypothetical protein